MGIVLTDSEIAVPVGASLEITTPSLQLERDGTRAMLTASVLLENFIANEPGKPHEMDFGEVGLDTKGLDVRLPGAFMTFEGDGTGTTCYLNLRIRINNFKKKDHPRFKIRNT